MDTLKHSLHFYLKPECHLTKSEIEFIQQLNEIFATCSSEKDRLRCLRTILKNESYDLRNYLGMELTSTGTIRARGLQGKLFINQLWEKVSKQ